MTLLKNLFVKKLQRNTFIVLLFFALIGGNFANSSNYGGINLAMEGSYFKVSSTVISEIILNVQLVNLLTGKKHNLGGCFSQKCSFNINHLQNGNYKVIVKTNSRNTNSMFKIVH